MLLPMYPVWSVTHLPGCTRQPTAHLLITKQPRYVCAQVRRDQAARRVSPRTSTWYKSTLSLGDTIYPVEGAADGSVGTPLTSSQRPNEISAIPDTDMAGKFHD